MTTPLFMTEFNHNTVLYYFMWPIRCSTVLGLIKCKNFRYLLLSFQSCCSNYWPGKGARLPHCYHVVTKDSRLFHPRTHPMQQFARTHWVQGFLLNQGNSLLSCQSYCSHYWPGIGANLYITTMLPQKIADSSITIVYCTTLDFVTFGKPLPDKKYFMIVHFCIKPFKLC